MTTRAMALAVSALALLGARAAEGQADVDFPLGVGIHIPSYDRVDGLTVPFGPTVSFGKDRLVIAPTVAYRSHLGKIDGALDVTAQLADDSLFGIALHAERGTFTNDRWIRSDLINSVVSLGLGHDARNYFRADRIEGRFTSSPVPGVTLYAGARDEMAWSTGWRPGAKLGPWSAFGREDDTNGIQRPNPAIDRGRIISGLAGAHVGFDGLPGVFRLDGEVEVSGKTPVATGSFQQLTLDGAGSVSTLADQKLVIGGHLVTTYGSRPTPIQRYAYVGGSGSLATVDLLTLGGDHLYFVDMLYMIPIPGVELPLVGRPYIAPHFASGAAAVGGFGRPVQNLGGRLGMSIFSADFLINPRTHKKDYGVGFSFPP